MIATVWALVRVKPAVGPDYESVHHDRDEDEAANESGEGGSLVGAVRVGVVSHTGETGKGDGCEGGSHPGETARLYQS